MTELGVTGPRRLTPSQRERAAMTLRRHIAKADRLHVGDATGVDRLAAEIAAEMGVPCTMYKAEGRKPYQLAHRSKTMAAAVINAGGYLLALPNKPCPKGLTHRSWKSSGTWGTTCYSKYHSGRVTLAVLEPVGGLPDWMNETQTSLL